MIVIRVRYAMSLSAERISGFINTGSVLESVDDAESAKDSANKTNEENIPDTRTESW